MARVDLVEYLKGNLPRHPVDELRRQLLSEGVSEADFKSALATALRAPAQAAAAPVPPATAKVKAGTRPHSLSPAARVVGGAAGAALLTALLYGMLQGPGKTGRSAPAAAASAESGFVGQRGWVVRLPGGYTASSRFVDGAKAHEVVHFSPQGLDPTNFLNEGLYGQLGIVRVEVFPSPFPDNPTGAASMAEAVSRRLTAQGEKFTLKNIQVATLPGLQASVISPFPRVEAFVLGKGVVYWFYGGQEDSVWRDIVLSLRDVRSES